MLAGIIRDSNSRLAKQVGKIGLGIPVSSECLSPPDAALAPSSAIRYYVAFPTCA